MHVHERARGRLTRERERERWRERVKSRVGVEFFCEVKTLSEREGKVGGGTKRGM